MTRQKIARRLGTCLVAMILATSSALADSGCIGNTTAFTGNTWLLRAGQAGVLPSERCVRISDILKTEAGASHLLRLNGFGILGLDSASAVYFDAHYYNPAHPELSVLAVALREGSVRYASRFPRPSATAHIMIPRFDSSVHVLNGAVHVELQKDQVMVRVRRGMALVDATRKRPLELVAPATLFIAVDGSWLQRKNREEIR